MGFIIKNNVVYGGGGGAPGVELTQEEYDALSEEEQLDGTVYYITDGESSGGGSSVEVDPTLTIEGAAADAKAVGDALINVGTIKYNADDDHNYYLVNNEWVKGEKVNLFWDYYLYNNGTINGNYAGDANENYKSGSYGSSKKNTNSITLSQSSGSQSINFVFENKVDLSKYNKIIFKGAIRITNASSQSFAQIGISSDVIGSATISAACEKFITSAQYTNTSTVSFTLELDVVDVTGEKYIYFGLLTGTSVGGAYGYITAQEVYVQ